MAIFFGGQVGNREKEYLYIDGGCLRSAVAKICRDSFGDENAYQAHIPGLGLGEYDKVFYYDAVPGKDYREAQAAYEARVQPDHERFSKIQALDRVHVALGQIVGADRRQKGVDVRLAVDMIIHAFRGNITKATLFAGDADFIPLIKALVDEGLHVTLWHPLHANAELKGAADSTRIFNFQNNYACLTIDGLQSAFQANSSGSGSAGPADDGLENIVTIDNYQFAGRWQGDNLKIWRGDSLNNWTFINFSAPNASLARALMVFDLVNQWGVASTGEQWIKV